MGLPIFGASNYSDPQWVPEPDGRGTWGLVQTCLLTLGLCVYSAIHLNVFHRECKWWTRWLIRCKWLLVALLAPEFIVFNAWSQRRQAVRIAGMLRDRSGQEKLGSRILALWRRLWPRARIFDRERAQYQEKRQAGHTSDPRIQRYGQERGQALRTPSDIVESEPQEQGQAQKSSRIEITEVTAQVRLRGILSQLLYL